MEITVFESGVRFESMGLINGRLKIMNLSFERITLICLLSTVKTVSSEQILLRKIRGAYHSVGCRVDQVKCYNSDACVSVTRVCDKIRDCNDNSDEIDCYRRPSSTTLKPRPLTLNCTSGYTRCYDNSQCIPLLWICDGGVPDCPDKSDEIDCFRRSTTSTRTSTTSPILNCFPGYTRCYDNSKCIPIIWICDGGPDCSDFSDEIDCYRRPVTTTTTPRSTTTLLLSCSPGYTKCYDNSKCVPLSWICDNFRDCGDNSDEIDCYRRLNTTSTSTTTTSRILTCDPGFTSCYDNSKCISVNWICDRDQDCNDNSDEIDCYRRPTTTTTNPRTTTRESFNSDRMPSTTNARSLSTSFRDSNPMPTTTADAGRFSTPFLTCPFGYTRCYDNSKCVPISYICDGLPDCPDGSDERDCYRRFTSPTTSTVRPACSSGQMMCFDNSACISVTWICNNIQDCADNSDERYCYCGLGQLMCLDGSRCTPVRFVCDNHQDCNDNSDERYCPQISSTTTTTARTAQPINCYDGFIGCYDNSKCIPIQWICDGGAPDCTDGSDEIDCYRRLTTSTGTKSTTDLLTCASDETSCYDGSRCVPLRWICDGDRDCVDNSDEIDCYRRPSTTLPSSTVTTPYNIPISCSPGYTKCYDNSKCVPLSWICDNFRDCGDNSDEIDCYRRLNTTSTSTTTTSRILTCSPGFTNCYDNSRCISVNWICDRDQDCNDNSDEIDCYRRPTTTAKSTRTTTTQILTCASDETSCYDGSRCVPLRWICDGDRDCVDYSDEIDCYRIPTTAARTSTTTLIICTPGYVKCYYESRCVPLSWICDGSYDCSDNTDEIDCYRKQASSVTTASTTSPTRCSAGQMMCSTSAYCVPAYWVCDGVRDCNDGSDEANCPTGLQTTSNELSTLASSTETTQTLEITTTKPCSVTDIAPLSTVTFAPSLNPKPTSLPYDLRAGGSVTLTFTDTSYVVNVWLKVSNVVYVTLFTDGGTDKEAAFNGVEHDYLPSPVSTSEITIKLDGSPADTLSISELIVNVCT